MFSWGLAALARADRIGRREVISNQQAAKSKKMLNGYGVKKISVEVAPGG